MVVAEVVAVVDDDDNGNMAGFGTEENIVTDEFLKFDITLAKIAQDLEWEEQAENTCKELLNLFSGDENAPLVAALLHVDDDSAKTLLFDSKLAFKLRIDPATWAAELRASLLVLIIVHSEETMCALLTLKEAGAATLEVSYRLFSTSDTAVQCCPNLLLAHVSFIVLCVLCTTNITTGR